MAVTVTLDPQVDLALLSRGTPGFSGADLENLVNEAALIAARRDQPAVLQRLREIGIDYAQGFLVHRPEPLEALVAAALPRLVGA